jgi:4-diphosphocytidyl-2-C-methyl-D-erythritol kinase
MTVITATAPAKLNLFLHVVGKRSDGYHLLESLVAFTDFGDQLTLQPSKLLSMELSGPYAEDLERDAHNNLVMKAATELRFRGGAQEGAKITLEKNIPIAAGLGGGSSDAGTAIEQLCRLWKLWSIEDIKNAIAVSLGADVKMCMKPKPSFVTGVGDKVSPVKFGFDMGVVLVNPRQQLLTSDIFKSFEGAFSASKPCPSEFATFASLLSFLSGKYNDLLKPAAKKLPDIESILHALRSTYGCKYASMSGSGATCFGLYENQEQSTQAAHAIAAAFPSWWVQGTFVKGVGDGKA